MVDHDGRAEVDVARFGETEVDLRTMEIRRSGEVQPVEPQVFDVLVHLIRHRDRVVSKEQLLDAVWGSRFVSESALTSRIKTARRAVGDNGRDQRIIRTHHGRGYRFIAELEHEHGRPAASTPASRADRLLLERDDELAELEAVFEATSAGPSGAIVLVSGEAGIGKSSLVSTFTASVRGSARVLAGTCDDLLTPRSLGPFHDMGHGAPEIATALATVDREALLSALGGLLDDDRPTVFVVEDTHWADDATLDVLRWLLRRLVDHRGLVVLTYRSTDVAPGRPLQRMLGAVPASIAHRIELPALGTAAVAALVRAAGRDLDAQALARVTGGNPFFVTEVLADTRADIPSSVVDAVIARLHALPVDTVRALQTCSVIPGSIDLELAAALLGDVHVLDEAERRGMLIADGEGIRFRHELARRAIEGSLTDLLRVSYHCRVLEQLVALDASASRLVHHATGARDIDKLLEFGARAAREAASTGAPRQAAEHFAVVLEHADRFEASEEALLRASHAYELFLLNELETAETEARHAVRLAEGLTDSLARAEVLATLVPVARLFDLWEGGAASDMARRAIELLGDDPPAELEATACVNLASDLVQTDQHAEAASWTERGLAAARRAGRKDLESLCLMYRATSKGWRGDPEGEADLREAIERAEALGVWSYAARGCHNMVGMLFRQARLAEVPHWIDRAVTDSEEGEFYSGLARARAMRGGLNLYLGRWDEAEAELRELTSVDEPKVLSWLPLALLGRLLARRGHSEAAQVLARAEDAIAGNDDPQRLLTVRAARVEHAWLAGGDAEVRALAATTLEAVGSAYHPQLRGELLRYVKRAGGTAEPFDGCPVPYALALDGDFNGAAEVWRAIGFPFERALELADVGEPEAVAKAIDILDRLGARPAAKRVRDRATTVR